MDCCDSKAPHVHFMSPGSFVKVIYLRIKVQTSYMRLAFGGPNKKFSSKDLIGGFKMAVLPLHVLSLLESETSLTMNHGCGVCALWL